MGRQRVIVAMSGGVDSAVAAGLLACQGYEVVGVTMRLWAEEEQSAPRHHRRCCSVEDIDDARAAADALNIPHYVLNLEDEFGTCVVDYFVEEYLRGRTPNPCLPCNEHVKFRSLLNRAAALGARYLATGHHARIRGSNGAHRLLCARDSEKDQSYVLYMLGQGELNRLLFPVGDYRKAEIRELAREMGLPVDDKPDSADICFLPDQDYRSFIAGRVPQAEGCILDHDGRVLGRHQGIAGFTIGQRRGLGIALGERMFVTSIDPRRNVVTIGTEAELLSDTVIVESVRWIAGSPPAGEFEADVKIRYRTPAHPAVVRVGKGNTEIRFRRPQRAIASGQAAVLYQNGEVLGGGIMSTKNSLTRGE